MKAPPKTKVDLKAITNKYPLLGLFLLVVEALLGLWLCLAQSAVERVIAGVLMTAIFGAFLFVVLGVVNVEAAKGSITAPGVGTMEPGNETASETEVAHPEPEKMGASDGSYIINRPPPEWKVLELTFGEWVARRQQITGSEAKEQISSQLLGAAAELPVLLFEAGRDIVVDPIPGKTLVNGREFPTVLKIRPRTQLAILSIERVQPPMYIENPLEHSVLPILSGMLAFGVVRARRLDAGQYLNSRRRFLSLESRQELDHVRLDGQEEERVWISQFAVGIEGDVRDYILFFNYLSLPGDEKPELAGDLEILRSLVSSFRPLGVTESKRAKMRQEADQKFADFVAHAGPMLFIAEFYVVVLRCSDWDLNDPERRLELIQELKPFEFWAQMIGLDSFSDLWEAMHQAEAGDAAAFKEQIAQFVAGIEKQSGADEKEPAALPPSEKEQEGAPSI